jgi:hypothetical protein
MSKKKEKENSCPSIELKEIDYSGYKNPVHDKDIEKALRYDRNQYEVGYRMGYYNAYMRLPLLLRLIFRRIFYK